MKSTLSKKAQKAGWEVWYEDNPGGLYARHGQHGLEYYIVEVTDMDDACGRDNEGQPKYCWEAKFLDLTQLSERELRSAMDCCGTTAEDLEDWETLSGKQAMFDRLAENCKSYGHSAPLESGSCSRFEWAVSRGIAACEELRADSSLLQENLSKPKNRIGTTGYDLLRGDIMAGLTRTAERVIEGAEPTQEQSILMRCYAVCNGQTLGGVTEESLDLSQLCQAAIGPRDEED